MQSVCVMLCTVKTDVCGRSVDHVMIEPTLFCSSSVKGELMWLYPEELKFKAKKYFCCLNIDRTTVQSLQMERFAHFLCSQANLHLCLVSPLRFFLFLFLFPFECESTELLWLICPDRNHTGWLGVKHNLNPLTYTHSSQLSSFW